MIENFQLPAPPPEKAPSFQGWLQWISNYGNQLFQYMNKWEQALSKQFNTLFNDYGKDIAAAANMTVSAAVHQVTGSVKVTQLSQPPGQTAVSVVTLFAKDGFSIGAANNVATPMSIQKGGAGMLAYHPALKKWLTVPGNPVPQLLTSSGNSPFTVIPGSWLFITADTALFTANLPSSPELGDWVYGKKIGGSFSAQWQPPAGVAINNQSPGNPLTVAPGGAMLMWIGTQWASIFQSNS